MRETQNFQKKIQDKINSLPAAPKSLVIIQSLFTKDIQTEFDWKKVDGNQEKFLKKKKIL